MIRARTTVSTHEKNSGFDIFELVLKGFDTGADVCIEIMCSNIITALFRAQLHNADIEILDNRVQKTQFPNSAVLGDNGLTQFVIEMGSFSSSGDIFHTHKRLSPH